MSDQPIPRVCPKQALRHDIMLVIKANELEVHEDFWFMLIFRTESELREIAQELHIKVEEKGHI